jgi:signal transduction histidine kinase
MKLPPVLKGLSARLLVLTIFFIMLSEVLIYVPSIARFRLTWLEERLAAAHLAGFAIDATPARSLTEEMTVMLLAHVEAYTVDLFSDGINTHMLSRRQAPAIDQTYDLRQGTVPRLVMDALMTLTHTGNRIIRVIGPSPKDTTVLVEMVIDEQPLRLAMVDFSERILLLSILISLITASLVFTSLQLLLVTPMRRITESMVKFRNDPENSAATIEPSGRRDEIGTAQQVLADLQSTLRAALHQKTRLAGLGVAVAKINHDLRNILVSARLVSDRLAASDDPEVRRQAPRLLTAIDRAVDLCGRTLDYAQEAPPTPRRGRFLLTALLDDVAATLALPAPSGATLENLVPADLEVVADRDQLFRVLANLVRNAIEAGAPRVRVTARIYGGDVTIEIEDNGAGIPPRALERLFQPFSGSARAGGTGLGLSISRDLARAHGGDVRLVRTGAHGTIFVVELPSAS